MDNTNKGYLHIANGKADDFTLSLQPVVNYNTALASNKRGLTSKNLLLNGEVLMVYWTLFDLFHIKGFDPYTHRKDGKFSLSTMVAQQTGCTEYKAKKLLAILKNSGLLKTYRYPTGEIDKFQTLYDLMATADNPEITLDTFLKKSNSEDSVKYKNFVINLSAEQGRKRVRNGNFVYAPDLPNKYVKLTRKVLHDKTLSLKAKFVYCLLLRAIALENGTNFELTKNKLNLWAGFGRRAFNTAWINLKTSGYLIVRPVRKRNRFEWEYEIFDKPEEKAIDYYNRFNRKHIENDNDILRYKKRNGKVSTLNERAVEKTDYTAISKEKLQQQINYDELLPDGQNGYVIVNPDEVNLADAAHPVKITKQDVNKYLATIQNIFKSTKSYYNIGGKNISLKQLQRTLSGITAKDFKEICFRIKTAEKYTEIQYPTAYYIAVMYQTIHKSDNA